MQQLAKLTQTPPHKVIDLMEAQADVEDMGNTQRLGAYPCKLRPGTVAAAAYDIKM